MEQTHLFVGIYMINKGRFKTTDCYQFSTAAGATEQIKMERYVLF